MGVKDYVEQIKQGAAAYDHSNDSCKHAQSIKKIPRLFVHGVYAITKILKGAIKMRR